MIQFLQRNPISLEVNAMTVQLEYFTPPQASKLLGVSVDTIHQFIRSGKLKASDLGQAGRPRWKIAKQSIHEFMDCCSNAKPAPPPRQKKRVVVTGTYTV